MMLFQIFSLYLARRYLATFLASLAAITFVIFLVDFTEYARRFGNLPVYSADVAMLMSLMRVPNLIVISVPFMVLIATMSTLMGLNSKYELVIARASGLSVWQFLMPFLICNFIIGIITVVAINPLGAAATNYANQLALEAGFGDTFTSEDKNTPWLRQSTDEGTTIIGGRSGSADGRVLLDVTLIKLSENGTILERLAAKSATLTDNSWLLSQGERIDDGQTTRLPENYSIKTNLRPEFVQETFTSADMVSFFDLPSKILAARSFGFKTNIYNMKLHQLIALPALLVSMTLIAAMVSLNFVRFGQSLYAIMGGILCGFLIYVLSELITAFGEAGSIPPIAAAWLPVLLAVTIATTALLHKEDG